MSELKVRSKTLVLAEQNGCSRSFYLVGKKALKYPGVRSTVHLMTPPRITQLGDGAMEETCCFIFGIIFVLLGTFIGYFTYGYIECTKIRYLSLTNSSYCESVLIPVSSNNYLDDKGVWDTSKYWAFGETMCVVQFVGFETGLNHWHTKASVDIWQTYRDWNEDWENNILIDNLISMVVSEKYLNGSNGFLAVRVLADPKSLMRADRQYIRAVSYSKYSTSINQASVFGLSYQDIGNTFSLTGSHSDWKQTFPNWKFATQADDDDSSYYFDDDYGYYFDDDYGYYGGNATAYDDYGYFDDNDGGGSGSDLGITLNKYSVWVAAAVNMGLLKVEQLTDIQHSSYYASSQSDDNANTTYDPKDPLLTTLDLNNYVLMKYYKEMEPIRCTHNTHKQYCWVAVGTSDLDADDDDGDDIYDYDDEDDDGDDDEDDDEDGALLFPLMQHWDHRCTSCDDSVTNGHFDDDDNETYNCNNLDLVFLLYFNSDDPYQPHYVNFTANEKQPKHYYDLYNNTAGLNGLIYMDFWSGIEFLNSLFYEIPKIHCDMPIQMAKAAKNNNPLACGSDEQQALVQANHKAKREAAKEKFCYKTPEALQEKFYECNNSQISCVSSSMAAAQGYAAITNLILVTLLIGYMISFRTRDSDSPNNEHNVFNYSHHRKHKYEDDVEMHTINNFSALHNRLSSVRNSAASSSFSASLSNHDKNENKKMFDELKAEQEDLKRIISEMQLNMTKANPELFPSVRV